MAVREQERSELSSVMPDLSGMPLDQLPPAVFEPVVQRILPGSRLTPPAHPGFSSHI